MRICIKHTKQESLFFIYFAILTIGKSFSLNANRFELQFLSVFAIVLLIIKLYNSTFTLNEFVIITALGVLGLIIYYTTKREGILLSIITIMGLKGISYRKLLSMVFKIRVILFFAVIALASLGVIHNAKYFQWREGIGMITRYGMGYEHPNLLHTNLFLLIILFIYLNFEKLKFRHIVIMMVINTVIYKLSYSRTGYFTISMVIIGTLLMKRKICSKTTNLLLCLVLPGTVLFTLFTAFFYGRIKLIDELDILFTGRIYYSNYFLTQYPINLFGYDLAYDSHLLDNGYIVLLINYGIIIFSLYTVGNILVIRRLFKRNMTKEILMISSFALYGVAEGYIPNIFLNFSLIFISDLLFHNMANEEEKTIDCKEGLYHNADHYIYTNL